jgi:hypothetical protein
MLQYPHSPWQNHILERQAGWHEPMKELDLAPYHLFQHQGNNYVFDVESSAVMKLDGPAYDALALRLEGATDP